MSGSLRPFDQIAAGLPAFLKHVNSLVLAVVDDQGRLVDANAGFLRLIGDDAEPGSDVSPYFLSPTFGVFRNATELAASRSEGLAEPVYRGLMTVGRLDQVNATLNGEVHCERNTFLIVAEYDIDDLEGSTAKIVGIADRLSEKQRELIRAKQKLEQREAELEALATTDSLTGLSNRRYLTQRIEEEVERSNRTGTPLSVVMLDIDEFKDFNDTWGHLKGDTCLEAISRALNQGIRPYDTVARFGGEEFVLVLPGLGVDSARERAESLREAIAAASIEGVDQRVTASFGVAVNDDDSADELLRRADEALYAAKEAGRNRVQVAIPTTRD